MQDPDQLLLSLTQIFFKKLLQAKIVSESMQRRCLINQMLILQSNVEESVDARLRSPTVLRPSPVLTWISPAVSLHFKVK
mmetsp:Transcript_29890/g.45299  ORF Transcript_29890/g.45299 Transcript_29890/m.45299 type:complete len:80 (-) Transcript_29890:96-335(-)